MCVRNQIKGEWHEAQILQNIFSKQDRRIIKSFTISHATQFRNFPLTFNIIIARREQKTFEGSRERIWFVGCERLRVREMKMLYFFRLFYSDVCRMMLKILYILCIWKWHHTLMWRIDACKHSKKRNSIRTQFSIPHRRVIILVVFDLIFFRKSESRELVWCLPILFLSLSLLHVNKRNIYFYIFFSLCLNIVLLLLQYSRLSSSFILFRNFLFQI
jgi:hypothetical protein